MIDRHSHLDQYDLFGGVAHVAPPVMDAPTTEIYYVKYRAERLPDGTWRNHDYSHLPLEKRPIREVTV